MLRYTTTPLSTTNSTSAEAERDQQQLRDAFGRPVLLFLNRLSRLEKVKAHRGFCRSLSTFALFCFQLLCCFVFNFCANAAKKGRFFDRSCCTVQIENFSRFWQKFSISSFRHVVILPNSSYAVTVFSVLHETENFSCF